MIVWLASYPRSGNALLRQTVEAVYHLKTWSCYPDGFGGSPRQWTGRTAAETVSLVKTHENDHASTEHAAIYLVRDGRDAMVSYAHHIADYQNDPRPYLEILRSLVRCDDPTEHCWSRHTRKWWNRDAVMAVVRYEDLVQDPIAVTRGAVSKLHLPLRPFPDAHIMSFLELHERDPRNFRRGIVGSHRDEMPPEIEGLFWEQHGAAMATLGYGRHECPHASGGMPIGQVPHVPSAADSCPSVGLQPAQQLGMDTPREHRGERERACGPTDPRIDKIVTVLPKTDDWLLAADNATTPRCLQAGQLDWQRWIAELPEVQGLGAGDAVLDIGAFIGDTTRTFTLTGARVLAFEPQDDAFECLEHNCPEAILYHVAVGDGDEAVLAGGQGGNLGGRWSSKPGKREGRQVSTVRIDSLDLSECDLVKIDVEGFEPYVLSGMCDTIRRFRPVIIIEVNDNALRNNDLTRADIEKHLDGYQKRVGHKYTDEQFDWVCVDNRPPGGNTTS